MIEIRKAVAADSQSVFAMTREFATSFTPEPQMFAASFGRLISNTDALLLVAEDSESIVGYLLGFVHDSLFANGRVAWVEELMVNEDRRRKGIGRELLGRFEEWARGQNSRLAALATRRAGSFYSAMGYHESAAYFRKIL